MNKFFLCILLFFASFNVYPDEIKNINELLDTSSWIKGSKLYKLLVEIQEKLENNQVDFSKGVGSGISLISRGLFQEALWSFVKEDNKEMSEKLKEAIKEYLKISPIYIPNRKEGKRALDGETEVYQASLSRSTSQKDFGKFVMIGYFKPKNIDWHSNYEYEYASYLFDEYFQLDMVPITVIRKDDFTNTIGSMQIGVKLKRIADGAIDYKVMPPNMIFLDYLLNNTDRHRRNYGILDPQFKCSKDGIVHYVAIDHSISFFTSPFRKGIMPIPEAEEIRSYIKDRPDLRNKLIKMPEELKSKIKELVGSYKYNKFLERIEYLLKVTE